MVSGDNFWKRLPKNFLVLAPMEDVTDTVFRQIVCRTGRPDVFFTEFTNTDGLDSSGYEKVAQRLKYTEIERPLVAQIWGVNPDKFYKSAKKIVELGFDGIDINFGCPERSVVSQGACGGMICGFGEVDKRRQVDEIVKATKEGSGGLPVSVKTRIGKKEIITEDWLGFLLNYRLSALTVHGRTIAEQSAVDAHWDEIEKVVKMRDRMQVDTLIIGNGDIKTKADISRAFTRYRVDGVMVGRGIFENPWIFSKDRTDLGSRAERLELLGIHLKLWGEVWGNTKSFPIMKKFVKAYVRDFEGAAELRQKLMEKETVSEMLVELGQKDRSLDF